MTREEVLYGEITELAGRLGFAAVGCAKAEALGIEADRYEAAGSNGCFASMGYLERNTDKRRDPRLLVPGAESVLVFLAPFGDNAPKKPRGESGETSLRVSEFALGLDYHKVIKDKLYLIAKLIKDSYKERGSEGDCAPGNILEEPVCRVFTDSAPVMERAWAVRAGLGFIGKNNFLISPECGIKNFIGVIVTSAIFPYYRETDIKRQAILDRGCGNCTRCIEACSQHALCAPYTLDASKCLSYKTIESRSLAEEVNRNWIFGCDDCMNACPWNSRNRSGWKEFSSLRTLVESTTPDFWEALEESDFMTLFKDSPLLRAGRKKICASIKSYLCSLSHRRSETNSGNE